MKSLSWKFTVVPKNQVLANTWDMKSFKDENLVDFKTFPSPPKLELFTEMKTQIHSEITEYPEQCIAFEYIDPDSTVLELGARYGSVSCIINKKLNNKSKQISVEPDETVWTTLEENIKRNNCEIIIHKGFISRNTLQLLPLGYAATAVPAQTSNIPSITIEELESLHHLKFDTLVADCEGFLEQFFDENPHLYTQLQTVIFEADYPNKCNYHKIRTELKKCGFHEIIYGFQNVYKK